MSTHSKTTRRTRWVVWLLVIFVTMIVVAISWGSTLWFTRDTIYQAAPENTVVAVRLFVSGKKGTSVESFTKNIPLISHRTLTFSDLAPYISGEFVLFINSDGSRSVAIREGNIQLPQKFLDAESVTMQSIGHKIVLLSAKQEILKPFTLKTKIFPGISFPGHRWIGELVDNTHLQRSYLYAAKDYLDISIPSTHANSQSFKQIPQDTIVYLSTPLLPNMSQDFLEPFLPLMQSVIEPPFTNFLADIPTRHSQLVLTKDKLGIGFFLATIQSDNTPKIDIEKTLRSISSMNTPKIQETLLGDGTSIKEIIASPDSVSVEQITLIGTQINRIRTNNGDLIAGNMPNNEIFFTNREDLFRTFKGKNKVHTKICSGNKAGILLQPLVDMQNQHANSPNVSPIFLFSQNFSSIGVRSSLFSTAIRFCK